MNNLCCCFCTIHFCNSSTAFDAHHNGAAACVGACKSEAPGFLLLRLGQHARRAEPAQAHHAHHHDAGNGAVPGAVRDRKTIRNDFLACHCADFRLLALHEKRGIGSTSADHCIAGSNPSCESACSACKRSAQLNFTRTRIVFEKVL